MIETGFTYLRNMLAKVEVTVKDKPRLRTVSDGNVPLPSSLTGKWLMTIHISIGNSQKAISNAQTLSYKG